MTPSDSTTNNNKQGSSDFFNRVFSVYGDQPPPITTTTTVGNNMTLPSHAAVFLISERHQKKLRQFLDPQEKLKHRHAALMSILGNLHTLNFRNCLAQ